jgi:hypothetical protein
MIESPLIDEVFGERLRKATEEAMQQAILLVLQTRFGAVPAEIAERLRAVRAPEKLNALTKHAAGCRDLEAFRKRLLK